MPSVSAVCSELLLWLVTGGATIVPDQGKCNIRFFYTFGGVRLCCASYAALLCAGIEYLLGPRVS